MFCAPELLVELELLGYELPVLGLVWLLLGFELLVLGLVWLLLGYELLLLLGLPVEELEGLVGWPVIWTS